MAKTRTMVRGWLAQVTNCRVRGTSVSAGAASATTSTSKISKTGNYLFLNGTCDILHSAHTLYNMETTLFNLRTQYLTVDFAPSGKRPIIGSPVLNS